MIRFTRPFLATPIFNFGYAYAVRRRWIVAKHKIQHLLPRRSSNALRQWLQRVDFESTAVIPRYDHSTTYVTAVAYLCGLLQATED